MIRPFPAHPSAFGELRGFVRSKAVEADRSGTLVRLVKRRRG